MHTHTHTHTHTYTHTHTHNQEEYLKKERGLEERLRDLRTNLTQLEQSRKMKEKTVQENRRKMAEISRELASLGSGGSALDSIEQDLRSAVSSISTCLI